MKILDSNPNLKICTLSDPDIKNRLNTAHPELFKILEAVGCDFKLVKASYAFGEAITLNGKLQLPNPSGHGTVPLTSNLIPKSIQNYLNYSSLPIGIILKNHAEVCYEFDREVVSLASFGEGVPLGLLETLEPENSCCVRHVWNVIAGSRSCFMLPKISDKVSHARLEKQLGFHAPLPREYHDHFNVFQKLTQSEGVQNNWSCEIIFLSKDWLKALDFNHHSDPLLNYLHHYLFQFSGFSRNKSTLDLVWHLFANELAKKGRKPNPYLFETLKEIVAIALGVKPCFAPQINDANGPFSLIQKSYIDFYRIQYMPTIFAPVHMGSNIDLKNIHQQGYYSLKFPHSFASFSQQREPESYITELYQLKSLLNSFQKALEQNKLNLEGTFIDQRLKSIQFDYFHFAQTDIMGIQSSDDLFKADQNFNLLSLKNSLLKFPASSRFFTGCIKITKMAEYAQSQQGVPLS